MATAGTCANTTFLVALGFSRRVPPEGSTPGDPLRSPETRSSPARTEQKPILVAGLAVAQERVRMRNDEPQEILTRLAPRLAELGYLDLRC